MPSPLRPSRHRHSTARLPCRCTIVTSYNSDRDPRTGSYVVHIQCWRDPLAGMYETQVSWHSTSTMILVTRSSDTPRSIIICTNLLTVVTLSWKVKACCSLDPTCLSSSDTSQFRQYATHRGIRYSAQPCAVMVKFLQIGMDRDIQITGLNTAVTCSIAL